jgi:hypothetical protein
LRVGATEPEPISLTEVQQRDITSEVDRRRWLLRLIGFCMLVSLLLLLVARPPIWFAVALAALEATAFLLAARHYRRIVQTVTAAGWRGRGATVTGSRGDYGCGYCADQQNRLFGHVTQIGSSDDRGTLLLCCPRCDSLYEMSPSDSEAVRLSVEEASELFPGAT